MTTVERERLSAVLRSAVEAAANPAMAAADWLARDIDPTRPSAVQLLGAPDTPLENLRKAKDVYKTMRVLGETSADRRVGARLYAAAIAAAMVHHQRRISRQSHAALTRAMLSLRDDPEMPAPLHTLAGMALCELAMPHRPGVSPNGALAQKIRHADGAVAGKEEPKMRIASLPGASKGGVSRSNMLRWMAALAALLVAGPRGIDQVGLAKATVAAASTDVTDASAITIPAGAACDPAWLPTFGGAPGVNPTDVRALTVFDDGLGGGPALYAGGNFTAAGGVPANYIAKWNGTSWSALGSGLNNIYVLALTVFDDGLGGGPALYAGGNFTAAGGVPANYIAKWNGTSWSALGSGLNNNVFALTVFDDGLDGGPALYAGGDFTTAGGVPANRIAKWNGTSWSALETGMNDTLQALTVFDDGSGSGPALYAGGVFTTAGGVAVNHVAKWNGTNWSALGSGIGGVVHALTVLDDGRGSGPALYAGGVFTTAGGVTANRIAKWNGTSWSALGSGMNHNVFALTAYDDGSGGGLALYASGSFTTAGGLPANRIAQWNGTSWSPLGSGIGGPGFSVVRALTAFDDGLGGGPALYAGGFFTMAGGLTVNGIAEWNGTSWSALGSGTNNKVYALTVFDDGLGGGPALYAAGFFTMAGGVPANYIAKWNGTSWSALGSGMNYQVFALTVFDDGLGGGPALCAGGSFTTAGGVSAISIAKWNGTSWSALSTGLRGYFGPFALTVFDDGFGRWPALYAGGDFVTAGGVPAYFIAKWNGRSWSGLGTGMNDYVRALTVFDDGSGGGPALYAGGDFTTAGGIPANRIAKWNGASWSTLGSGMNGGVVSALAVFDDGRGGGPALYAGGYFTMAGGVTVNDIAKWNGTSWSALATGMNSTVHALTVFDDGNGGGPALCAGGDFFIAGGVPANRIARWNGTSWSALGSGMNAVVRALSGFDDGLGGGLALYAGGDFTSALDSGDSYIARWGCAAAGPVCPWDCGDQDGEIGVVDFLGVLSQWGQVGTSCDFDGGGTGVTDFLEVLAHWGPCP